MGCKDCGDPIPQSEYRVRCMGCYRVRMARMCYGPWHKKKTLTEEEWKQKIKLEKERSSKIIYVSK